MSIHEHEEWEREMMNDYYFQPSTAFDQAAAFRQEDHRLDTVEPMDTINHMEWWPDQDGLPMGFDPVDGSVAAEPAIASPYQPFGDPLISSTSDTPTARDYDYSMYDYGDGYDEQGGVEESAAPHPGLPAHAVSQQPEEAVPQSPVIDVDDPSWTYAVEVWPACDVYNSDNQVVQNIIAIQDAFTKKGIDYSFCLAVPVGYRHDVCRRYTLPRRYRDSERARLDFLQVFNANRPYNVALPDYRFKMSVVSSYEPKNFHLNPNYPDVGGDGPSVNPHHRRHPRPNTHHGSDLASAQDQAARFSPSAFNSLIEEAQRFDARSDSAPLSSSPVGHNMLAPLTPPEAQASPPSTVHSVKVRFESDEPRFNRPIPKPERKAHKNSEGKFECTFADCTEEVRTFSRRCEWSKHMDKHDRPYRCPVEGCEKLPGFTYGGGLLRHQREVHGQHGGPRNPLNCPHVNCKRHTGKGFSRLENLNEHLRRVHTGSDGQSLPGGGGGGEGSSASTSGPGERTGEKRKAASAHPDESSVHEEVKRLRTQNQHLNSQIEAQKRQTIAMMNRIRHMQSIIDGGVNVGAGQSHAGPPVSMPLFDGAIPDSQPF